MILNIQIARQKVCTFTYTWIPMWYMYVHSCRQCKLISHLKSTGRYYAFKKHLKTAVLNLVRQKFLSEASIRDPGEMEVWSRSVLKYGTKHLNILLCFPEILFTAPYVSDGWDEFWTEAGSFQVWTYLQTTFRARIWQDQTLC